MRFRVRVVAPVDKDKTMLFRGGYRISERGVGVGVGVGGGGVTAKY